jgi:hypothetical protein
LIAKEFLHHQWVATARVVHTGGTHDISKHALWRHRTNHVSLNSTTDLATAMKIIALLDTAATATTWNATLLTIRDARRYVEEFTVMLTLQSSREA